MPTFVSAVVVAGISAGNQNPPIPHKYSRCAGHSCGQRSLSLCRDERGAVKYLRAADNTFARGEAARQQHLPVTQRNGEMSGTIVGHGGRNEC